MRHKFAAQLYTLRNELEKDFPGTLRELKKMGWPAVQISGLRGWKAEEIAAVLKETGLGTAGMHVSLQEATESPDTVLEQAKLFNTKDIIVPYLPPEMHNEAGFRSLRAALNDVARKVEPLGYRVSYHNHAFEFETTIDGKNALDYVLDPVEGNAVLAEIDVYWVTKGGQDPVRFIEKFANRMPIIHLKDMTNDEEQAFAEVGTGQIDFIPILEWCEANGVEWYAVEQDVCKRPPLDCLATSLENLNKFAAQLGK